MDIEFNLDSRFVIQRLMEGESLTYILSQMAYRNDTLNQKRGKDQDIAQSELRLFDEFISKLRELEREYLRRHS